MKRWTSNYLIILIGIALWSFETCGQNKIIIDLSKAGRTFEGIGALSGGANSRLLNDYPEPYRSQIFDLLFKPSYGVGLQHLKVEIGSDGNSTCGTDPSHARTREELVNPKPEYFQRGYQWGIIKEAKKRNPQIILECLESGAPGWIGEGRFYSLDNIDYIIGYLKGALKFNDIKFNYVGIWNERLYNIEFILLLRKALDDNGLNDVQIVVGDLCCGQQWMIADDIKNDVLLQKAVSVIGDHYVERDQKSVGGNFQAYNSSDNAKSSGKPIWNSEGGPWNSNWNGFEYLARMFNRNYLVGQITKNIIWSLINSYYENTYTESPSSGLMSARTPWSGFYSIDPPFWAVAHTTLFTKPGWKYIDTASGYLEKGGSYVTLISVSTKKDFSLIAETMDAATPQEISITLDPGIKADQVFIWRTISGGSPFEQLEPLKIKKDMISLTLLPGALYSITTTKGQQKGISSAPENKLFSLPNKNGFEEEKLFSSPKYFSDLGGAFEVVKRDDQQGNCLRQVITREPIPWGPRSFTQQTIVGDTLWTDYSVKSEVFFHEPFSYATLSCRMCETNAYPGKKLAEAYHLKLQSSGKWELIAGSAVLATGIVSLNPDVWQTLFVNAHGSKIKAIINGAVVADITDSKYSHGMAGLGSSLTRVDFDNFEIEN